MKALLFVLPMSFFVTTASVWADDTHHPQSEKKWSAESASVNKTTAGAPSTDIESNMKTMRSQMEKIRATADPKERAKLLDDHMKTMQETMQSMRSGKGMMGCGMMGNDKMHKGRHEGGKDMMQMMMDQMMEHQNAMRTEGR